MWRWSRDQCVALKRVDGVLGAVINLMISLPPPQPNQRYSEAKTVLLIKWCFRVQKVS